MYQYRCGIMEQGKKLTIHKIPSGTIELEAKKITVLGQVYQQVPFRNPDI